MAYSAKDITVLKGLEPVRERPGMYIGSTGPAGLHHLVYEVVDNAVDEAMAGYATRIDVTLLPDGGLPRVRQRTGHPGRPPPRVPGQVGGRGRAHGAPRRRQVRRRGLQDLRRPPRRRGLGGQRALDEARPRDPPRRRASTSCTSRTAARSRASSRRRARSSATGTTVTFWPDPSIFEETEFRAQTLIERLREMAFLNRGLEIRFRDERVDPVARARTSGSPAASPTS